jgi:hypothetical protein
MAQDGEHLGQALGLVDQHRAGVGIEKAFEIRRQKAKVGRAFEVEVSPVRKGVAPERALSTLPRPQHEHRRKRPEERAKALSLLPWHISHTL